MCPRQFPASEENALFSTTYVSSRWRDPVATCSALWNPEAVASYNFIYSRFPPTARSGPSSPSPARLSSSSSGGFLGRKGIRRQVQGGAISQKAVSREFASRRADPRVGDNPSKWIASGSPTIRSGLSEPAIPLNFRQRFLGSKTPQSCGVLKHKEAPASVQRGLEVGTFEEPLALSSDVVFADN